MRNQNMTSRCDELGISSNSSTITWQFASLSLTECVLSIASGEHGSPDSIFRRCVSTCNCEARLLTNT